MVRAVLAAACAALAVAPAAGAWTWPAEGEVLRPFVLVADPYAGGQHRGVDVAGSAGAAVVAPAGGTVAFAGFVGANGRTVTIATPDGYAVTLTHLGTVAAMQGTVVAEGAPVGTIGPTGTPEVAGPYVHLGVRLASGAGPYVDPLTLLPPRAVAAAASAPGEVAGEPAAAVPAAPPQPELAPLLGAEPPAAAAVVVEAEAPAADAPAPVETPAAVVDAPAPDAAAPAALATEEPLPAPQPAQRDLLLRGPYAHPSAAATRPAASVAAVLARPYAPVRVEIAPPARRADPAAPAQPAARPAAGAQAPAPRVRTRSAADARARARPARARAAAPAARGRPYAEAARETRAAAVHEQLAARGPDALTAGPRPQRHDDAPLASLLLVAAAVAGVAVGARAARKRARTINRRDVLPDDADLLHQRDAAHRPRVHDPGCRHPRPAPAPAWGGRVPPHRHRRARVEGPPRRGGAGAGRQELRGPDRERELETAA